MKKYFYLAVALLGLAVSSCNEGDDNIDRECDYGFEGTVCDRETRQKFIGSHDVEMTTNTGHEYEIQITKDVYNVAQFRINNITNDGYEVLCKVSADINQSNAFTIDQQEHNGHVLYGSGGINMDNGDIDIFLVVDGESSHVRTLHQ